MEDAISNPNQLPLLLIKSKAWQPAFCRLLTLRGEPQPGSASPPAASTSSASHCNCTGSLTTGEKNGPGDGRDMLLLKAAARITLCRPVAEHNNDRLTDVRAEECARGRGQAPQRPTILPASSRQQRLKFCLWSTKGPDWVAGQDPLPKAQGSARRVS